MNCEIDDVRVKQKAELQTIESELRQLESHLNHLNEIIRKYVEMSYPKQEGTAMEMVTNAIRSVFRQNSVDIESYLRSQGYIRIEDVYEEIPTVKKIMILNHKISKIRKHNLLFLYVILNQ